MTDALFYKWGGGLSPGHPRVERAYDEFLVLDDGREIIDAAAGAAVANLGHSVEGVGDVLAETAEEIGYLSLSHFEHGAAERLAKKVADRTPGDLSAVFPVTSGSEAVESAIKLARAYHVHRGNERKQIVISRWQSYHGATLGALSASGNSSRRTTYRPLLHDWPKIPAAHPGRWEYEGSPEEQAIAAARELERAIEQEGADSVAAFFAEPVGGASLPAARPRPAYYREVRRICDEHDVLFVADEVMTGFGRTGPMFACEHYDVVPDMMTLGKGLSGGYAPVSAVAMRSGVAETLSDADVKHGHTYNGHPSGCAVAAHVVDHYDDDLLAGARDRGERLAAGLAPLENHPMVAAVRHAGMMFGIEFARDGEPFDPDLEVASRVYDAALEEGVYTYPGTGWANGVAGDHLMLTPPLTTSEESLQAIADAVSSAIEQVGQEV